MKPRLYLTMTSMVAMLASQTSCSNLTPEERAAMLAIAERAADAALKRLETSHPQK